jgi:hypothetical protein
MVAIVFIFRGFPENSKISRNSPWPDVPAGGRPERRPGRPLIEGPSAIIAEIAVVFFADDIDHLDPQAWMAEPYIPQIFGELFKARSAAHCALADVRNVAVSRNVNILQAKFDPRRNVLLM